ncbi:MAG: Gfo/Idh/MocA family oxidoreductase [Planctomycetota bacterium]
MADKIRWGVIGSGGIAKRRTIPEGIIPAENAELAVVYDIDPQANAEVAGKFGAKAAGSIDELLAADIQAVYIATPAGLHHDQTIACAKAARNILCEKPLGMTVRQAEDMIAACESADVLLGTAFMMRFHSQHQAALQMIQQGKLGKPTYARAQLSCWYPPIEGAWRQDPALGGGGSLMDMGGHCIDLLEMFFGKVRKVSCFINNTVHNYESEDSAVATLFFENGAIGVVDTFFCIPDNSSKNVLELYGSHGSILARGTIGQADAGEMVAFLEAPDKGYDAQQTRAKDQHLRIAPVPVNTYRAEIEEFSRAIIENRKPANDAAIGLQSQKTLEACYKSAKKGRTIELD